jgi:membrane protein DedA with SNARE-associated domain
MASPEPQRARPYFSLVLSGHLVLPPMHDLVFRSLAFLKDHQSWAGLLLGLGACFEAFVVIGALAPLTPLLVMVGAAIKSGVFAPTILLWTMGGCGLGNWISYEAGRRARQKELDLAWIPDRVRKPVDALFNRFGLVAIVIGRFLGPTASVTPFLAGVAAMPRGRFLLANVTASLVWPIMIAGLGYLGASTLSL